MEQTQTQTQPTCTFPNEENKEIFDLLKRKYKDNKEKIIGKLEESNIRPPPSIDNNNNIVYPDKISTLITPHHVNMYTNIGGGPMQKIIGYTILLILDQWKNCNQDKISFDNKYEIYLFKKMGINTTEQREEAKKTFNKIKNNDGKTELIQELLEIGTNSQSNLFEKTQNSIVKLLDDENINELEVTNTLIDELLKIKNTQTGGNKKTKKRTKKKKKSKSKKAKKSKSKSKRKKTKSKTKKRRRHRRR